MMKRRYEKQLVQYCSQNFLTHLVDRILPPGCALCKRSVTENLSVAMRESHLCTLQTDALSLSPVETLSTGNRLAQNHPLLFVPDRSTMRAIHDTPIFPPFEQLCLAQLNSHPPHARFCSGPCSQRDDFRCLVG